MDDRVIQFRVGIVVLAAFLIGCLLVVFFWDGGWLFSGRYTLYVPFEEAPGVTADSPIRKNGVLIGRVDSVELRDDDVLITLLIDGDRRIGKDEQVRIGSGSLFGDAILEVVKDETLPPTDEYYVHGDTLPPGKVGKDPLQVIVDMEDDLERAIASIDTAGQDVSQSSRKVNEVVSDNEEQLARLLQKSELAIDQFRETMASVDRVVGDEELNDRLKRSLERLPTLLEEAETTFVTARSSFEKIDRAAAKAEENLDYLTGFTKPLGERGPELVEAIESGIRNIDLLLSQLVAFSTAMNNREGSLGRLIYDRALYDRIDRVAANLEDATARFRPIVEDIRIFTDKVARDPRQLGIKGALDRRPAGMGTKTQFPSQDGWQQHPVMMEYEVGP